MNQSIRDVLNSYANGTTVRSVVEQALGQIAAEDATYNAIRSLHDRDALLAEADQADARWQAGTARMLEGVPIILKDNISVRGELTGAASKVLDGYRAPYDATVTRKLREAGAIILGKGNMDEFAMGSSGENSAYGATKNAIDPSRVAGGSSSGPAVAVAKNWVPVSIGTDTGGSVRLPASFNGVVGFRPTYGRISRSGVIAMASSLDQISPFTNTVADAATMLEVLAGVDSLDQTTRPDFEPLDQLSETLGNVGSPRVASFDGPADLKGLDPQVRELIVEIRARFVESLAGSSLTSYEAIVGETAAKDFLDLTLDTYYILVPAEVSSNLARYDGLRYGPKLDAASLIERYVQSRSQGFGSESKRRTMLGTHVLSSGYADAYYKTALKARDYAQQEFAKVFESVDVLMGPTSPTTAFKLGEKTNDPLTMYLSDLYAIPSNIAGACSISVPCGAVDGLPVGMQLIAAPGNERRLLQVAHAFEQFMQRAV